MGDILLATIQRNRAFSLQIEMGNVGFTIAPIPKGDVLVPMKEISVTSYLTFKLSGMWETEH